MATKPANAKQKQWMKDIAEWAENNIQILYGNEWSNKPIQLHHVLGRSAKHNKVAIGHEFVLPVPFVLHDVSSDHPSNVTHYKHKFTDKYGKQRDLFLQMIEDMRDYGYELPPYDVCESIRGTSA
ncbi:MAG TPA: hypothetical protein EYN67_06045 [Flavobacteriales bacterium]|nr:hypothetical protein [Flavobacteriales bacterium]